MSRVIKFRAWLDYGDGSGEMLPNIQNHINGKWAFGHIVNGSVDNISNPMQFTGLTDKNGVEIYEGDIANCPDEFRYKCIMDDRGCFVFCNPDDNLDFYFLDDMDFEVIGNIHQNPELLK